jgi:hypothetical protein
MEKSFVTRTSDSIEETVPTGTFRSLVININIAAMQTYEWEISSTNQCKILKFCMVANL